MRLWTHTAKVWVLHDRDNVGTVLGDNIPKGARAFLFGAARGCVIARAEIPCGHKIALKEISRGASIVKYGEVIGQAITEIAPGEHVHIHNLESVRGRGDRRTVPGGKVNEPPKNLGANREKSGPR